MYWNAPKANTNKTPMKFDGFTSAPRHVLWKGYARWKASGIKPTRKEIMEIESDWDYELDLLDMMVMRAEPQKQKTDEPKLQNSWDQ